MMKQLLKPGVQTVTYGMAEASFKFHSLIQDGLSTQPDTHIYSVVGRAVSPLLHSGNLWKRVVEKSEPRTVDHLGFPNFQAVKQLWLAASFVRAALVWRWRTRRAECRILIVDAAYVTVLPGVLRALSGGGISKVGIFADLYGFMADVEDAGRGGSGPMHSLARRVVRRVMKRVYSGLDGFVLLTEQMNDVVNPLKRPHLVMEGLVDADMAQLPNRKEDKETTPTVLYAGALRREYGLGDLVEGFRRVANPHARLVLFGGGDFVPEISAVSAMDPRISYGGSVPISQVVREEQRAWLLVNPRPVHADFTKYSFPSKNMEYMASGTPVLTTRLPGMPAEYYPYVLTVDQDGPEGIHDALEKALSMDIQELCDLGDHSRQFVLNEKNHIVQADRILQFAKECNNA
jgi:glycosyltransferase involved in cell wall biosynthesis